MTLRWCGSGVSVCQPCQTGYTQVDIYILRARPLCEGPLNLREEDAEVIFQNPETQQELCR